MKKYLLFFMSCVFMTSGHIYGMQKQHNKVDITFRYVKKFLPDVVGVSLISAGLYKLWKSNDSHSYNVGTSCIWSGVITILGNCYFQKSHTHKLLEDKEKYNKYYYPDGKLLMKVSPNTKELNPIIFSQFIGAYCLTIQAINKYPAKVVRA